MSRPISATINQSALCHNLNIVRSIVPHSYIWSVVKANAYGHGLAYVWKFLKNTDGFALLNIEDAIFLRQSGWEKPILLLEGFFHKTELLLIDYYRLTISIHNEWQIKELQKANLSSPINVYLKINSGMNRLGFHPNKAKDAWISLRSLRNVSEITIFSHFFELGSKEVIVPYKRRIQKIAHEFNCPYSLSSSNTIIKYSDINCNWVRIGIILYGASPTGKYLDIMNLGLQPVMTLSSEIISIQCLNKNDYVGYGYCYKASHDHRIGIVACGYADGYPRHIPSTGAPVYVEGTMTKTVGNISMDMMAIDLEPCPNAKIGSKVELWGNRINIDTVAQHANTIGYHLMCSISSRVSISVI